MNEKANWKERANENERWSENDRVNWNANCEKVERENRESESANASS